MRTTRILALLAILICVPATASARSVLSPGELSVGAEFHPFNGLSSRFTDLDLSRVPTVSPSIGFIGRYAFSSRVAVYGNAGFFHRFRKGNDPATFYAIGLGGQVDVFSSRLASFLFRGGLQFLPREDDNEQEFGVRLYVGPGFESRVADNLSLQIYSPLVDVQIGGDHTDFDLNLMPHLALFLYF